MWLVYPLTPDDVRKAKWGVGALLAGSAVWYLTVAGVLAVRAESVLYQVRSRFADTPAPADPVPGTVLVAGFVAAGLLRLLGYLFCRNVVWAVGAGEGLVHARLGVAVWLAAGLTLGLGYTGLLAIITAVGAALELRFLRFPAQLFGMVMSLPAVRWVDRYFLARAAWLGLVVLAALVLLLAHALSDVPRPQYGPTDERITEVNAALRQVFNPLAGAAVAVLPFLAAGYWLILFGVLGTVGRLLDPNGPVVPPQPPDKPGFDQLKHHIRSPLEIGGEPDPGADGKGGGLVGDVLRFGHGVPPPPPAE